MGVCGGLEPRWALSGSGWSQLRRNRLLYHHAVLAAGGYRSQYASGAWFLPDPAWLAPQRITVWYMAGPFRGWRAQTTWTGHTTSFSLGFRPDRWRLVLSGETAVAVFRFVPLPLPPVLLVGGSLLISLGWRAWCGWRRRGAPQ